jgi:hypothetical protein
VYFVKFRVSSKAWIIELLEIKANSSSLYMEFALGIAKVWMNEISQVRKDRLDFVVHRKLLSVWKV